VEVVCDGAGFESLAGSAAEGVSGPARWTASAGQQRRRPQLGAHGVACEGQKVLALEITPDYAHDATVLRARPCRPARTAGAGGPLAQQ
jgi:hypothetical protein